MNHFEEEILAGIPADLPEPKPYDPAINHAPRRKDILSEEEKVLALRNALRYFPERHHAVLAPEFAEELRRCGRIYGGGADKKGDILKLSAYQEAFEMGAAIR